MDWLANLITVLGGGAALWLVMGLLVKLIPPLDGNSNAKFVLAMILAFVIPVGAYFAEVGLKYAVFTYEGLFLAIGVAYTISQGVHRGTEILTGKK